jgi:cyclase
LLRPRIIPSLLVHKGGLIKTRGFKDPKYIGDPINAVRIFSEKEADELMVFDIDATINKSTPNFNLINKLAAECRMPLCYGGGITSSDQANKIIDQGVEKIAISAAAIKNPSILSEIANSVGSQSVVAIIDLKKKKSIFGDKYEVYSHNGLVKHSIDPFELIKEFENAGAGEVVINFIDKDGLMEGYDIDMAINLKKQINVPLTILGGAGTLEHIAKLIRNVGIIGVASGSLFVFKGKYRAVLINYPTREQKIKLCEKALDFYFSERRDYI